jgi:Family of unknown function (DUF6502)
VNEPAPKRTRAAARTENAAAAALFPEALTQAMRDVLEPLAALAVARGVPFATVEEMLKTAFVDAARAAHPELAEHRAVSRISTATGINRREVARVSAARSEVAPLRRSPAERLVAVWLSEPSMKRRGGGPKSLLRQGPAPSFEALAQSITRDVHPRSLLDELCRLGVAVVEGEEVRLLQDSFVPQGDTERMLRLLGRNVGDHLRSAVANVTAEVPLHLEQAIFTDELSQHSAQTFRQSMRTHWKALVETAVPALQRLIDDDRAAGRLADHRVRVGIYTFNEPAEAAAKAVAAPPKKKAATRRKST